MKAIDIRIIEGIFFYKTAEDAIEHAIYDIQKKWKIKKIDKDIIAYNKTGNKAVGIFSEEKDKTDEDKICKNTFIVKVIKNEEKEEEDKRKIYNTYYASDDDYIWRLEANNIFDHECDFFDIVSYVDEWLQRGKYETKK